MDKAVEAEWTCRCRPCLRPRRVCRDTGGDRTRSFCVILTQVCYSNMKSSDSASRASVILTQKAQRSRRSRAEEAAAFARLCEFLHVLCVKISFLESVEPLS